MINKGHYGSFFIIADVGRSELMHELGVHHKHTPEWIPDHILATQYDDPTTARQKLRPDIMVVEMTSTEQRKYANNTRGKTHKRLAPLAGNKARKVWLVAATPDMRGKWQGRLSNK